MPEEYQPTCDHCGAVGPQYQRISDASLSKRYHKCGQVCINCKWATPAQRSRGLCNRCYRSDARHEYPAQVMRSDLLIEDVEWLVEGDANLTEVVDRLGIKDDTLWRALRRAGRIELFDRLADREPDGDHRRSLRKAARSRSRLA